MSTRERILDAAAEILRTRGVAQATTKEIAQASKVSEPTLYKYFGDKERLLLTVLEERVPGLSRVSVRPGTGDVEDNLTELAHAVLDFYQASIPMLGALLADPQRMAAHREAMSRHGGGPEKAVTGFAAYLRVEQELGRVAPDADPDASASLLIGACFQEAFLRYYAEGPNAPAAPRSCAAALARAVVRPLM
ncbi:TetR/AcrR family transcriptional regulator [Streptomyces sp. NPDC059874]|uniref:TetR/AcrR family transcriptional regulator n=1 Tax=Streptomyces sp. NPDC059874 TaxID=3346983 RepID=UPI0036621EF8